MREIEFRGKDNHGTWRYGAYVAFRGLQGAIYYPIYHQSNKNYILRTEWCYVDEETVGQYTGLKDKNGKKIYEGDIVNTQWSPKGLGVITWHPDGYFFIDSTKGEWERFDNGFRPLGEFMRWFISDTSKEPVRIEVIGNIYDNPELLK